MALTQGVLAVLTGMRQAGAHPFSQNLSFELGEDRQECGHGPARRRRQVEGFSQGNETDPEVLQFLQGRQQVRHRPPPPIQSPYQYHVDFAAARRLQ